MELDLKEISKKFFDFFEEVKIDEIRTAISSGTNFLNVGFFEINSFDYDLGEVFLNSPKDCILVMEEVLKNFFDDSFDHKNKLSVRIFELPKSEKILIKDIRTEHLDKLLYFEGQVRRKTDVRPRLKEIHYLCTNPACTYYEERIKVPQFEEKTKALKTCPRCKSPLNAVEKVLVDFQNLVIEELSENLKNQAEQPKRINIMLEDDLVSAFKDSKTNPGSRVKIIGIVKEIPKISKTGAESVNFELVVLGNSIELLEDDYTEIEIDKKEEEEIIKLSKQDDILDQLVDNFSPSIYGLSKIKEAIILQLFGGCKKQKEEGISIRGDIHILLVGDPGAAKSQMLKVATKVAPKSSYVSGKSASGVGLTASVVRDDLMGGWALEAGSLVLASGGLAAIDEMDKMSDDDTSAMHEALEQQSISIAKANIKATLRCETTVLGAANPKYGRFNPYESLAKQIAFPPALISRFDLIFILTDEPNKIKDEYLAKHILMSHTKKKMKVDSKISTDIFRKYIAYAKKINPKLTDGAIEKIKDFYVRIRDSAGVDEMGQKAVPITARQLEAIIRLSEAHARIKLSEVVEEIHATKAIEMLMYCLEKVGVDPKTNQLDIDIINTGISTSSRNMYKIVSDIIDELETTSEKISYNTIIEKAAKINIKKDEVDKVILKLRQEGLIYEVQKGIYKKTH